MDGLNEVNSLQPLDERSIGNGHLNHSGHSLQSFFLFPYDISPISQSQDPGRRQFSSYEQESRSLLPDDSILARAESSTRRETYDSSTQPCPEVSLHCDSVLIGQEITSTQDALRLQRSSAAPAAHCSPNNSRIG